jgi:hypothetical protein
VFNFRPADHRDEARRVLHQQDEQEVKQSHLDFADEKAEFYEAMGFWDWLYRTTR